MQGCEAPRCPQRLSGHGLVTSFVSLYGLSPGVQVPEAAAARRF